VLVTEIVDFTEILVTCDNNTLHSFGKTVIHMRSCHNYW